jgi:hypothetical protein
VSTIRSFASQVPATVVHIAVGVLLIGLHASLEIGSQVQNLTYDVVGASAVAAALFGVWRNRPDRRAKAQGKGRYHVFRETDPDARAARDQTWVERGPTVRRRDPLRLIEPRLEPGAG